VHFAEQAWTYVIDQSAIDDCSASKDNLCGAGFWKTDGAQVVPLFGMYIRGSPAIAEVLAGETQETHRSAQFRT